MRHGRHLERVCRYLFVERIAHRALTAASRRACGTRAQLAFRAFSRPRRTTLGTFLLPEADG